MSSSATSSTTAKENLKATFIVFFGIVIGIFVFMLVAIFMDQAKGPFVPALDKYNRLIR